MSTKANVTYEFACQHLYPDCDTRIKGKSQDDVLRKAQEHVKDHHGAREYQDDVVRDLRAWIRPAV